MLYHSNQLGGGWLMTKKVGVNPGGGGPDDDDNTVPDGGPDYHDSNPDVKPPQYKIPNPFQIQCIIWWADPLTTMTIRVGLIDTVASNFPWPLDFPNPEHNSQKRELSGPQPFRGVPVDSSKLTI